MITIKPLTTRVLLGVSIVALVSTLNSCGSDNNDGTSSSSSSSSTSSSSASSSSSSSSSSSASSSSSGTVYAPCDPANPMMGQPVSATVDHAVVRFVYFVEQGETCSEASYNALVTQAFAMQQYWHEQFGGTFYLYGPVVDVIYATHEPEWYLSTPDGLHSDDRWYRLGNIKKEVYTKLNIRDFDPDVRVINYPTTRHDGRVGGNFGGAWMDGDDLSCLLGENSGYNFPYDNQNPAHCLGHVSHEFGHIYGLDHTGPNSDCMQYGFYIGQVPGGGMCQFSEANRNIVVNRASNATFLAATPGDVVRPDGLVESR